MKKKLRINSGFITNSSSVIYHFPKELWEHPEIQALARAYGVAESGYVGDVMCSRSACETIAVTPEEKKALEARFYKDFEPSHVPGVSPDYPGPILVYGDEYEGLPQLIVHLAHLLHEDNPEIPYVHGDPFN